MTTKPLGSNMSYDYKHGFREGYKQGYIAGLKLALMANTNARLLIAKESLQHLPLPDIVSICKVGWDDVHNLVKDLMLPDMYGEEFIVKESLSVEERMILEGKQEVAREFALKLFSELELPLIVEVCKLGVAEIKQLAFEYIETHVNDMKKVTND